MKFNYVVYEWWWKFEISDCNDVSADSITDIELHPLLFEDWQDKGKQMRNQLNTWHSTSVVIATYYTTSAVITTYHITSVVITTYHTASVVITTYHTASVVITTYHITSVRITIYHTTSVGITTYHTTSVVITSYQIPSFDNIRTEELCLGMRANQSNFFSSSSDIFSCKIGLTKWQAFCY